VLGQIAAAKSLTGRQRIPPTLRRWRLATCELSNESQSPNLRRAVAEFGGLPTTIVVTKDIRCRRCIPGHRRAEVAPVQTRAGGTAGPARNTTAPGARHRCAVLFHPPRSDRVPQVGGGRSACTLRINRCRTSSTLATLPRCAAGRGTRVRPGEGPAAVQTLHRGAGR
jgi:hypothetical protein